MSNMGTLTDHDPCKGPPVVLLLQFSNRNWYLLTYARTNNCFFFSPEACDSLLMMVAMSTGHRAVDGDQGLTGSADAATPVLAVDPVPGPIPDPDPANMATNGRGLKLPLCCRRSTFEMGPYLFVFAPDPFPTSPHDPPTPPSPLHHSSCICFVFLCLLLLMEYFAAFVEGLLYDYVIFVNKKYFFSVSWCRNYDLGWMMGLLGHFVCLCILRKVFLKHGI